MNEDRFISQQWYNHGSSLKLEAEARKKIDQKIHEKVNNNLGTWIDWQYLLDAAALLAKVCASLSKQSIRCNDLVQRAPYSIYHKSVTKKGFKWISCVIGDRMLRKSMPHDVHSKKRGLSIYVSRTNVPFFDPSLQLGQRSKNGTFVRET